MTASCISLDLLSSAIDLTRACTANENYLAWLQRYSLALDGSPGIANYFASVALAFEEQAHPILPIAIDLFEARDCLADTLMSSEPLSGLCLQNAVASALRLARLDTADLPTRSLFLVSA